MNELEQYLQTYFGVENEEERNRVQELFRSVSLKKGDFLAQTGKTCSELAFVRSGLLRIYDYADGREITQWISSPGYFVTELNSFLFQTPSRRYIEALTSVELYAVSRTDYDKLHAVVSHWPEFEKAFMAKCFTMMEDRIFAHLSMTAEERYQLFFEQNKELFHQVPLQYIASMLGMTPETFSRVRKKLLK